MLTKIRCSWCSTTLVFIDILNGVLEIKCTHRFCGLIIRVTCLKGICTKESFGKIRGRPVDKVATKP